MEDIFSDIDPEAALVALVVFPLSYGLALWGALRLARRSTLRTWIMVQIVVLLPFVIGLAITLLAASLAE